MTRPATTDFGGSITFSVNADDTLHVEWDMTGTGQVVCGFLTKDGDGNLVHYYSVTAPDQVMGSADLDSTRQRRGFVVTLGCVLLPGGGTQVPDGGTTVMLLGMALAGLGVARRYLKR